MVCIIETIDKECVHWSDIDVAGGGDNPRATGIEKLLGKQEKNLLGLQ